MVQEPLITIGQYSTRGRKDRNGDSYGVLIPEDPLLGTKGIAMAIADGMSTSEAAKEASESCVKSFLTDYYATHESWTVKTSVSRVLTATNRWLYGQGQTQYLSDRGMVSTFSGLVLKSGIAYIFHAGDTRISLLRDDSLEPLTNEHRTKISRREDYLSRAFGIDPELEVDYKVQTIEAGDILIFTSDGVHDFLSASETLTCIRNNDASLDEAAKELCELAYENGSPDNLTAQVIKVEQVGKQDRDVFFDGHKTLPFPPDLDPGMRFEGYEIIREIHASKKSQLYLAKDSQSGKNVVLKTPSINFSDDLDYIEHFTREAWIGRSLSSPHIVKVISPSRSPRFLYYAMEYIEGETLTAWLDNHPQPALFEVNQIIGQLIKGVRCFHRREMLHQDIKPDNIMIDGNGTVKLIDFGSTRIAGLEEVFAQDFQKRGTVDYIAPEYHLGARGTNRSDIFSLGVLAYRILTGKLPYGRGFATKRQVDKLTYLPADQQRNDIPHWLSETLRKAVNRDPKLRYESLSAFEQDLNHPNPKFLRQNSLSLLEKNPVAFWRTLAFCFGALSSLLLLKDYLF